MAGKKASVSSIEPRLGGVRVQTALYGQTIPVLWGTHRIPGNLVWANAFQAIRQEERSESAKGGGSRPSRNYYTYSASVAMLLCEGPIGGVLAVYKGKQRFTGQATTTKTSTAMYEATVPGGSPWQVTVPSAATWTRDGGVVVLNADPTSWPPYNQVLIEGIGYTAAAGVYTFTAANAGQTVQITYLTTESVASSDGLGELGLALSAGAPNQPVWSYLSTTYPAEAIPYSGFAYVRGRDYPLTNGAEVENHNFVTAGFLALSATGDAPAWAVLQDMLCNPRHSATRWPDAYIGDWSSYLAYCDAYGFNISLACLEQRATRDWMNDVLDATNTDAAWTGSVLKLIPRGDENAGSYVAPVTPVFNLGLDDFLADDGELPLRMTRTDQAETHNIVRAEYANRARDYNVEVQTADDASLIATYGENAEATQTWHFFCEAASVRNATQLRLQRKSAVRNTWEGRLPWRFAELEVGDLVTLTDPNHYLSLWPVKVVKMEEGEDEAFDMEFEDFPIGHATAPIVPPQLGSGLRPDFNYDPGMVTTPVFIEPPPGAAGTGLEVWVAVSGTAGASGAVWGGAEVYASLDGGTSYKLVGRVDQGARYGTLTAALAAGSGATAAVQLLGRGGQLRSVSAAEAQANATLCFVGAPDVGEFITFETATLTGANAYSLTGLRRGLLGTEDQPAALAQTVVYVDGALAMSGPLPAEMIGQEIKFKFTSFNVFGGGLQSLASVPEYSYRLTGRFRQATQAQSANMLPGATFDNGVLGPWGAPYGQGGTLDAQVTVQRHPSPSYYVSGTPGSVHLAISDPTAGTGRSAVWPSAIMSLKDAARFCAYVSLIGWGCDGLIAIEWLDINRQSMGVLGGTIPVAGVGVEDPVRRWNDPNQYQQIPTVQERPAGARYARVLIVAGGTWAAGTKYLSVLMPYFGELAEGTTMPPFGVGPSAPVSTSQLADESATQARDFEDATGMTLTADTWVFRDHPLYTFTAVDKGKVEITVTFAVYGACPSGGSASTLSAGLYVSDKRAVTERPVFTVAPGTNNATTITLAATVDVVKGQVIPLALRLSRTRFGLGTGSITDRVYAISGRISNVMK
jgi:hypothetical protein